MDLDAQSGGSLVTGDIILTISENNITFTTEQLTFNHRYNVTIRATNVNGTGTSYIPISECN